MSIKPEIGKRYLLADGKITEPLSETSLPNYPIKAKTTPHYYGRGGDIFFKENGQGIGGDKNELEHGINPDFQIVREYNPENPNKDEFEIPTKLQIVPGKVGGVNIWLDGPDVVVEVEPFYVNGTNLSDVIKVLQNLQKLVK